MNNTIINEEIKTTLNVDEYKIYELFENKGDLNILSYRDLILKLVKIDASILIDLLTIRIKEGKYNPLRRALFEDAEIIYEAFINKGVDLFDLYMHQDVKEKIIDVISSIQNKDILKYATGKKRKSRSFVLKAVKENGLTLQYATNKLHSDKEIILEAIKNNIDAIKYCNTNIFDDEFILKLCEYYSFIEIITRLSYDEELIQKLGNKAEQINKENNIFKDFIKEIINNYDESKHNAIISSKSFIDTLPSFFIRYYIDRQSNLVNLREFFRKVFSDKKLLLKAVKNNGYILQFTIKEYQDDYEVVLEAVKSNNSAMQYVSDRLKNNYEIALAAVNSKNTENINILREISEELQNNRDIVIAAVRNNGLLLSGAKDIYRKDKHIVDLAIKNNIAALEYYIKN